MNTDFRFRHFHETDMLGRTKGKLCGTLVTMTADDPKDVIIGFTAVNPKDKDITKKDGRIQALLVSELGDSVTITKEAFLLMIETGELWRFLCLATKKPMKTCNKLVK